MRFGSVCSGIEAASLAWESLGWRAQFFSEIEAFPSAVLAHRWPDVPNLGDFTVINGTAWRDRIDVLVAGTPCQAFSVAGNRKSLGDARGNLTLSFVELVHAIDPPAVVWENVPGVLSSHDNAFGCFLAGLVGHSAPVTLGSGQRWTDAGMVVGPKRAAAWRILDAQHFGVPQRRRRVFVASFRTRDGLNPGAVLFEPEGLRRDSSEGGEEGQDVARCLTSGASAGRRGDYETESFVIVAPPLTSNPYGDHESREGLLVADTVRSHQRPGSNSTGNLAPIALFASGHEGSNGAGIGMPSGPAFALDCAGSRAISFDTTQITSRANRSNPRAGDPCHTIASGADPPAIAFAAKGSSGYAGDISPTLRSMGESDGTASGGGQVAVAFNWQTGTGAMRHDPVAGAMQAEQIPAVRSGMTVRRLTPLECERLQGIRDGHTLVPWRGRMAPDSLRYKVVGNSMAVPCMHWIGERLGAVLSAAPQPALGAPPATPQPPGAKA